MAIVERIKQVGYASEVTELVEPVLGAASYGHLITECMIAPVSSETVMRGHRATFAPPGVAVGAFHGTVTLTQHLQGVTPVAAPPWFALARASGASGTGASIGWGAETGSPIIGQTISVATQNGVTRTSLSGVRGSLTISGSVGVGVVAATFTGSGRYSEAAESALVAGRHPVGPPPQPLLGATFSFGGTSYALSEFELAITNTVTPQPDATHSSGYGRFIITDQTVVLTVSAIEAGNWVWPQYRSASPAAIVLRWGAGTGNTHTLTGNAVLASAPERSYAHGIGFVSITFEFVTSTAAAAATITLT